MSWIKQTRIRYQNNPSLPMCSCNYPNQEPTLLLFPLPHLQCPVLQKEFNSYLVRGFFFQQPLSLSLSVFWCAQIKLQRCVLLRIKILYVCHVLRLLLVRMSILSFLSLFLSLTMLRPLLQFHQGKMLRFLSFIFFLLFYKFISEKISPNCINYHKRFMYQCGNPVLIGDYL